MPQQIRLWSTDHNGDLQPLSQGRLNLESRLQEWIAEDIALVDDELLIIGREVVTDHGGYIDLLAIDAGGDLVLLELKRNKTPREVTAQALDYASWMVDLSHDRISAIANEYLSPLTLEEAFRAKFGTELPENLNGDHRILVVASHVDASSERIIEYLSSHHGVNINAVTFQYYRLADDGSEVLARVFLLEPETVEYKARTKGGSKRKPNLTEDELREIASANGVRGIFDQIVGAAKPLFKATKTLRSSISFADEFRGSTSAMFNLIPKESTESAGLRYQVYSLRLAERFGIDEARIEELLPGDAEPWVYVEGYGPEWGGYAGFARRADDMLALLNEIRRSNS